MKRPLPHLRYWRFKDEEFSPFGLYVRDWYSRWLAVPSTDHHNFKRKNKILKEIEHDAKEFNISLKDLK